MKERLIEYINNRLNTLNRRLDEATLQNQPWEFLSCLRARIHELHTLRTMIEQELYQ